MKVAKKGSGRQSATLPDLLRVAISYGWIDGVRKALDEEWFLQKYGQAFAHAVATGRAE